VAQEAEHLSSKYGEVLSSNQNTTKTKQKPTRLAVMVHTWNPRTW
jgi:hypothetical protein